MELNPFAPSIFLGNATLEQSAFYVLLWTSSCFTLPQDPRYKLVTTPGPNLYSSFG